MRTTTVVIGAGQSGLALSRCLTDRSIDHVVLERSEVANSWRAERWDSLRLLTPNWQCQLPGSMYDGDDPDGFMTMPEVVSFLTGYARTIAAPVQAGTTVTSVGQRDGGYRVTTDQGEWECRTVALATGAFNRASMPAFAGEVPPAVTTLTPMEYRNPEQLDEGGVLVVGASATGVQIAHELQRSGRPVTLAVGEHVRGPRTYRGMDIHWWMQAAGVLDERYDEVEDIVRARRLPSMQLVGSPEKATIDLNALSAIGVRLVGRLAGINDGHAQFSGSLRNVCALADLKLGRLLDTIDEWASANGMDDELPEPYRPPATTVPPSPPLDLDLASGEIRTVIWATGFRPDYSWLDVPVLDRKGRIRHDGGVVASPGMYVIGLPFLRRRKSSFIHGAGDDARDLAGELAGFLARQCVTGGPMRGGTVGGRDDRDYDVVVVGARCAGAATAMLLARGGCDVLLVDRARPGSDTLSTHGLMRAGVLQLHRWGLLEAIVAAGTPPVRTVVFDYPDERVCVPIKPSPGVDALYAPRRTVLDPVIVEGARAAGVDVRFGVAVTELLRDGPAVTGVVGRDHGAPFSARAGLVIGADGARSTVARLAGARTTRTGSSADAVVYGYWEGVDAAGYEWLYRPGFAAGLIPTNDDRTLVFGALSRERFAASATGDLEGGLRRALGEHAPELLERIDEGVRVERLRGFEGMRGFLRRPWGPGWALVGDAGYFKDPITVHGITDALRDAELLANAVLDGPSPASLARYEAERDRLSHRLFEVTDRIASRAWTIPEVKALLREMSDSMGDELALLEGLDTPVVESFHHAGR